MKSVFAGCAGFPVARQSYFRELGTVEVRSSFKRPPRPETAARWRDEAPRGFVFSVSAWSRVTHPGPDGRGGHFRPGDALDEAWEATAALARQLDARFVVFETPASFYPNADHLRDLYAFFRRVRREDRLFVWRPVGGWDEPLVHRACNDLSLVRAVDPFGRATPLGSVRYFRMTGAGPGRRPSAGHGYGGGELSALLELCDRPAYVYFDNADSWRDALRLRDLIAPPLPKPRWRGEA